MNHPQSGHFSATRKTEDSGNDNFSVLKENNYQTRIPCAVKICTKNEGTI